jgi:hypothetical protein
MPYLLASFGEMTDANLLVVMNIAGMLVLNNARMLVLIIAGMLVVIIAGMLVSYSATYLVLNIGCMVVVDD